MAVQPGGIFSSGQDKGVILDYMLDKMGNKYDAIVFIDDGQANIHAMTKMFSKDKWFSTDFTIIHYTRVEDELIKQQGAVITTAQAEKWLRTGKLWLVRWQHYFQIVTNCAQ